MGKKKTPIMEIKQLELSQADDSETTMYPVSESNIEVPTPEPIPPKKTKKKSPLMEIKQLEMSQADDSETTMYPVSESNIEVTTPEPIPAVPEKKRTKKTKKKSSPRESMRE